MKLYWLLGLMCLFVFAGTSNAQFLVVNNYNSGTNINATFNDTDDGTQNRTLNGTYSFFGNSFTSFNICTNGFMSTIADTTFSNVNFPTNSGVGRIAPLWDDMVLETAAPATTVWEHFNTGFYSITWENSGRFNFGGTGRLTYQAVWFNAATTLSSGSGSFDFLPGDIAFDYQTLIAGDTYSATVGLDLGNGTNFAVAPGTTNGAITNTNFNLLPLDNDSFILFRDNGAGGYNVSIESFSAVPEPLTIAMSGLGLGAVAMGVRRVRHKRSKNKMANRTKN